MTDTIKTKVSNFRLGELMRVVRKKEREGWECASKLQRETTYEGLTNYFFIMEHPFERNEVVEEREEQQIDRQEFGDYLRMNRKSLNLNIREMSEHLNIHKVQLGRYERGQQIPKKPDAFLDHFRKVIKDLRS